MKIEVKDGHVEVGLTSDGKVFVNVGCMTYYPDGRRKQLVINSAKISVTEFGQLSGEVYNSLSGESPEKEKNVS